MKRLGQAMVAYIRKLEGSSKFLVVEGVPEQLALAISQEWDDDDRGLPLLAVASDSEDGFGSHVLSGRSAANLRHHDRSRPGICLVVCEGSQLAESQSIGGFVAVAPSDLLKSKSTIQLLADAPCGPIPPGGANSAVRAAIVGMPSGRRPSAVAVSEYFDQIAAGTPPLEALPILGAFRDSADAAEATDDRIRENLDLATVRRSDDLIKPGSSSDIRTRVANVVARRGPGTNADEIASRFMTMLVSGDDDILELVSFSEAKEILSIAARGCPRKPGELLRTTGSAFSGKARPKSTPATGLRTLHLQKRLPGRLTANRQPGISLHSTSANRRSCSPIRFAESSGNSSRIGASMRRRAHRPRSGSPAPSDRLGLHQRRSSSSPPGRPRTHRARLQLATGSSWPHHGCDWAVSFEGCATRSGWKSMVSSSRKCSRG